MKKYLATMLAVLLLCGCCIGASAATKTASNTRTCYGPINNVLWTHSVSGTYESNGKKVTSFGKTDCATSTVAPWTSSNKSSYWYSKTDTTKATVIGKATFTRSIPVIGIEIESGDNYVAAVGKP